MQIALGFEVRDILRPEFRTIGRFDTVTAIHLLEHFTNDEIEVPRDGLRRLQ